MVATAAGSAAKEYSRKTRELMKANSHHVESVKQKEKEMKDQQAEVAALREKFTDQVKQLQDSLEAVEQTLSQEGMSDAEKLRGMGEKMNLVEQIAAVQNLLTEKEKEWSAAAITLTPSEQSVLRGLKAMSENRRKQKEKEAAKDGRQKRYQSAMGKKSAAKEEEAELLRAAKEKSTQIQEQQNRREEQLQQFLDHNKAIESELEDIGQKLEDPEASDAVKFQLMTRKLALTEEYQTLMDGKSAEDEEWEKSRMTLSADETRALRGLAAQEQLNKKKQLLRDTENEAKEKEAAKKEQLSHASAMKQEAALVGKVKEKRKLIRKQQREHTEKLTALTARVTELQETVAAARRGLEASTLSNVDKMRLMQEQYEAMEALQEAEVKKTEYDDWWKKNELTLDRDEERVYRGVKALRRVDTGGVDHLKRPYGGLKGPRKSRSTTHVLQRVQAKHTLLHRLTEQDQREQQRLDAMCQDLQQRLKTVEDRLGGEPDKDSPHERGSLLATKTAILKDIESANTAQGELAQRHQLVQEQLPLAAEETRLLRGMKGLKRAASRSMTAPELEESFEAFSSLDDMALASLAGFDLRTSKFHAPAPRPQTPDDQSFSEDDTTSSDDSEMEAPQPAAPVAPVKKKPPINMDLTLSSSQVVPLPKLPVKPSTLRSSVAAPLPPPPADAANRAPVRRHPAPTAALAKDVADDDGWTVGGSITMEGEDTAQEEFHLPSLHANDMMADDDLPSGGWAFSSPSVHLTQQRKIEELYETDSDDEEAEALYTEVASAFATLSGDFGVPTGPQRRDPVEAPPQATVVLPAPPRTPPPAPGRLIRGGIDRGPLQAKQYPSWRYTPSTEILTPKPPGNTRYSSAGRRSAPLPTTGDDPWHVQVMESLEDELQKEQDTIRDRGWARLVRPRRRFY